MSRVGEALGDVLFLKLKTLPSFAFSYLKNPVNTAGILWCVADRINGIPLYSNNSTS